MPRLGIGRRREQASAWVPRRRRALELHKAGAPRAYIATQFGVSPNTVSYLIRVAIYDAASSDPEQPLGPVAEPLLDWLAQLPHDWAGMDRREFLERGTAAMGHPVGAPVLLRKLSLSDWDVCNGRLTRRVSELQAVA